jgi:hypothetical protein
VDIKTASAGTTSPVSTYKTSLNQNVEDRNNMVLAGRRHFDFTFLFFLIRFLELVGLLIVVEGGGQNDDYDSSENSHTFDPLDARLTRFGGNRLIYSKRETVLLARKSTGACFFRRLARTQVLLTWRLTESWCNLISL